MTVYAKFESRSAFLFTPFGKDFARRKFGDQVLSTIPVFIRGKHKGEPKGVVTWTKCVRGGWVRNGDGESGHVERRAGSIIEVCLRKLPEFGKDPSSGNLIERIEGNGNE